jgi:dephospho-CoA kinase
MGFSEAESRARIRSQLPGKERLKYANVVIDTDCALEELRAKVKALWQKFKTGI